jgi:hypothetical protein
MEGSGKAKRKQVLDKRIDQFCQTSAELITTIHERCGDLATPTKGKRGRKKKASARNLQKVDAD